MLDCKITFGIGILKGGLFKGGKSKNRQLEFSYTASNTFTDARY